MKKEYTKNMIEVLIYPIVFLLGQILIYYVFSKFFNLEDIHIIIISAIILIPLFYMIFKRYKGNTKITINGIIEPIIYGVTISLIYNILFYNLNNVIYFTNAFDGSEESIVSSIISAGIYGAIIEEIIFRGIVYNKLKEFNKVMTAIILTSVIFAFYHTSLLNALYGFGASFMLIYLYEKYKTLKSPIIMHSALNITTILALPLIKKDIMLFNISLLIISLIILIIMNIKVIKK